MAKYSGAAVSYAARKRKPSFRLRFIDPAPIRLRRRRPCRCVPINAPPIPTLCAGADGAITVGVAISGLRRCAGASVSIGIGVQARNGGHAAVLEDVSAMRRAAPPGRAIRRSRATTARGSGAK
jgi:hypothetical protein